MLTKRLTRHMLLLRYSSKITLVLLTLKDLLQLRSTLVKTVISITRPSSNNLNACFNWLEFKQEYKNHTIECVVDNARTHSAKSHLLLDFGKGSGTRCPVDKIEYKDSNDNTKSWSAFFKMDQSED